MALRHKGKGGAERQFQRPTFSGLIRLSGYFIHKLLATLTSLRRYEDVASTVSTGMLRDTLCRVNQFSPLLGMGLEGMLSNRNAMLMTHSSLQPKIIRPAPSPPSRSGKSSTSPNTYNLLTKHITHHHLSYICKQTSQLEESHLLSGIHRSPS